MNPSQTALTDALVAARRGNRTLDASPWTDALATAEQAYEVQDAVAAALGWFDAQPVPGT
jgi:2-keto-4-pentenoate hydratase